MPSSLRIALAQINPTVGNLVGNAKKISEWIERARVAGADLVAFPELSICGYLPEDLLLQPKFIDDNLAALASVAARCRGIVAIVGFVDRRDDLYNAAAVIHDGRVQFVYHKQYLPNYGVFDEGRYFKPGVTSPVFTQNGVTIGVNICEDIWHAEGPATVQAIGGGAQVIVNITASPYHVGKPRLREAMLSLRARENGTVIVYANCVGGQDEIVFDGGSLVYDATGKPMARAKAFEEDLLVLDVTPRLSPRPKHLDPRRKTFKPPFLEIPVLNLTTVSTVAVLPAVAAPPAVAVPPAAYLGLTRKPSVSAEMYRALMLGLSDYTLKNGFKTVVLGLSGGIDSALTAAIATDALGAKQVVGVFMPSCYTSQQSREDATQLATHLGIRLITLPIEEPFEAMLSLLSPTLSGGAATAGSAATAGGAVTEKMAVAGGRESEVTEENLQARIRGNILMALSNRFGWLVLATGNKSEISVGYTTLYGDMAGGFAVIKDLWKTEVYKLARFRNQMGKLIPQRTIRRAPTAELRPNQTDQDTLPPYALLDPILQAYIEDDQNVEEILVRHALPEHGTPARRKKAGDEGEAARLRVLRVLEMVERSEFKRKQAPVGTKITRRALGKDRRMPITHQYLK